MTYQFDASLVVQAILEALSNTKLNGELLADRFGLPNICVVEQLTCESCRGYHYGVGGENGIEQEPVFLVSAGSDRTAITFADCLRQSMEWQGEASTCNKSARCRGDKIHTRESTASVA